jgi:nitroimidazol reductase NimA-like FMN-containing flavoprotein (pyridoxamine 5'-phosphate oxidase superfamily)
MRAGLVRLGVLECQQLIAPGGVGRIVFISERGPVAFPVNYRLDEDDVVFRTAGDSDLVDRVGKDAASFEVDHIDGATRHGWSVLMTGSLRLVDDPDERARLDDLGIEPWAGGDRDVFLRLVPFEMSGRRVDASE